MAISSLGAARRICERSNWSATNLSLQKILYIAHMMCLGRSGGNEKLIDGHFEAWDYGPVEPNVYRKVRVFGDRPIEDIFFSAPRTNGRSEVAIIDETCDYLLSKRPGELVAITHWEQGAWAKNYVPRAKGIVIPTSDILAEYIARTANAAA